MTARIDSSISTKQLEFDPSRQPPFFEVKVINLSGEFASFRLELAVAGAPPNLTHHWYKLSEEISAKIPSGDMTKFLVTIIDTPIPGLDLVNVTITVSSLELPDFQRHRLSLMIKSGTVPVALEIFLAVPYQSAYPRQPVKIPVRVYNPSQQTADVVLKILGFDSSWLNEGSQRRLLVGPGRQEETSFSCQPPVVVKTLSKQYTFTVEASLLDRSAGSTQGILEILPIGTVLFNCKNNKQAIPKTALLLPQWKEKKALFELEFKNVSNLSQIINLNLIAQNKQKINYQVIPPETHLQPGQTQEVKLEIIKKRPWWGLGQKILLEAGNSLSDQRLGKSDPQTQSLELVLKPIIPLWLQLLITFVILLLILLLLPYPQHSDRVNSVAFSGVVNPVLSGSDDQTVRLWKVDINHPFCKLFKWQRFCLHSQGILYNKNDNKAVKRLKIRPVSNDQVAIGLENGEIILYDCLTKDVIQRLKYEVQDTVLSLAFTQDSKYLFSGHGETLRKWNIESKNEKPTVKKLGSTVEALAFSLDDDILIAAGRNNIIKIGTWLDRKNFPDILDDNKQIQNYPTGGGEDYIYSLASINNFLITGDNRGYMRIWNLQKCAQQPATCKPLHQWYLKDSNNPIPIRSIAVRKNDNNYYLLAGAGNQIILWSLDLASPEPQEKELAKYKYSNSINSVDLIYYESYLYILSGDDDFHVKLNFYPLDKKQ